MSMRSIYHKACPSCAALIEVETGQCECGYSFDSSQQSDQLPDEFNTQDQELFREYLNARLAQAVSELQEIRSALVADPKNLQKAERVMRAYLALKELRQELDAQKIQSGDGKTGDAGRAAEKTAAGPTAAFRATQARKAEQVMNAAGMDTKSCPKCQAVMPERALLCFCGYSFGSRDRFSSENENEPAMPAHGLRKNL